MMLKIALVLGAGIAMMISFFIGTLFGAVTMLYLKERKNDNVKD